MPIEVDTEEAITDEAAGAGETVTVFDVNERAESVADAEPISYYGSDFDVHGLVRRLKEGDIIVPNFDPAFEDDGPIRGFQRGFVWRRYQMERFVESLLLGYPVPGIFLVQQEDKTLLVLDGQQRLKTLAQFYDGEFFDGSDFALEAVADDFKGLTYRGLAAEDRRTLDNTFIHATIVKFDPAQNGERAVYQLFERLNTGGTNLYPQEIRVALYTGPLVDYIRSLNLNDSWRNLYGPVSGRLKDQEMVLRFLALYTESEKYERPLKGFLNDFLSRHRELTSLDSGALTAIFSSTCAILDEALGRSAFRTKAQVNAALADAVMVGMARRVASRGAVSDNAAVKSAHAGLLANDDFVSAIARATADEDRVARRLSMATQAFSDVG
jgi:hypothetical protein